MGGYSIWLVQTGEMLDFPRSQIFYGAHNSGLLPTPLGFVVVRGEGHLAVIDTGFQTDLAGLAMAAGAGVGRAHAAPELLAAIGLDPLEVDTVILTHAHWDHMGNLPAFPNATIYLQQRELDSWRHAMDLPARLGWLAAGVLERDFEELDRRSKDGAVRMIDGPVHDLLPGIDLLPAFDTHTWGHQSVLIRTGSGPYVAVGDLIFNYSSVEGLDQPGVYVPTGQAVGSQETTLAAFDEIMGMLGGDAGRIIPVHDFAAYHRNPSAFSIDGLSVAEIVLAAGEPSLIPAA